MPARARHDEQRIARRWAICAIASRSSEAIYATAAVSVFPLLFFPKSDPTTALLASLATFGLAFVALSLIHI